MLKFMQRKRQFMFIDSHAHLTDKAFDDDREEIINNLKANNVAFVVNIGVDLESSFQAVELAKKHENFFAVVGFQPENCKKCTKKALKTLENLAKNKKVIGVGEIGLDYYYGADQNEEQKNALKMQIELANSLGKNIVIHMRDCDEDMKQILLDCKNLINKKILFHCFNASVDFMQFALKNFDAYFAFGGIATYKNSFMPTLIANCPRDRILAETDCPYLTPTPLRGKCKNEPRFIKYVYEKIADIYNLTVREVEGLIEKNFKTFLGE